MATKYWQVKLKGEKTADEIHLALGRGGANIVRLHVEGGETHVYLAGDESLQPHVAEAAKSVGGAEEVQLSAVTKLT